MIFHLLHFILHKKTFTFVIKHVKHMKVIFTARIRRMTEGNVFTLSTIAGGPLPRSRGVPPSQVQAGVPLPRSRQGGTPFPGPPRVQVRPQDRGVFPLPVPGEGNPPSRSDPRTG